MVHYFVVYLTMWSVIRPTQRRRRGYGNQEYIRIVVTLADTERPMKNLFISNMFIVLAFQTDRQAD